MSDEKQELERESILLRILWMVIFVIVWQLAELLLGAVVLDVYKRQVRGSRSELAAKYDGAGGGQPGHPASACRDAAADAQS